jgi:iron complex outermembrane receptor protein
MTVAAAVGFAIAASSAKAQQQQDSNATAPTAGGGAPAAGAAPVNSEPLQEVVVTGTRTEGMQAALSPAPIQILSPQALQAASGNPQLMDTLARLIPSLTIEAFGFDQAGNTLMARLRGLSPNDVLILVNGKRRHTTASLAVDGGSVYQGGANVDLNFIPLDAIDHVEVLTDGAAAQYGSDAIAGVINIILKDKSSGGSVTGSASKYFDNQGPTGDVAGNFGFEPYDGAFFNLTAMIHNHGHTFKSGPDAPAILSGSQGDPLPNGVMYQINGWPYINPIIGDGEQHTKLGMINAGFPFADNAVTAYLTASYGYKESNSYENYRVPDHVSYTNPTGKLLIPYTFGFLPQEENHERDYQVNAGFKGVAAGWNWDLGYGYGQDHVNMYTIDTVGNSFYFNGLPTPSGFYDGFLEDTQAVADLDINRDFDVGMAGPLNVAFGFEYRHEFYEIGPGNPESYLDSGASSFPGFTPANAGSNDRKNESVYLDLAGKPLDALTIDLAGRHEHYSDFGSATVGKLTARYDFTPQFALRGTISNGFRAPTLAEEFYSATNVAPSSATAQLPPNSPGGRYLVPGGLQAEKSTNYSVGFVFRPLPTMTMTLDLYRIDLNNRIKGTQAFNSQNNGKPPPGISVATQDAINHAILLNGNTIDPSVLASGTLAAALFANGIDTVTQGADLVFQFPETYSWGHVNWQVSGAYNDTYIKSLPPNPAILAGYSLYSIQDISDLTSASPRFMINLGGYWTLDKWSVNLTEHIVGPSSEYASDGGHNPTNALIYYNTYIGTALLTDLSVGFKATKNVEITIGSNNLFNKFPPHTNPAITNAYFNAGSSTSVQIQPIFSPYGINGGLYYGRVTLSW